MSGSRQKATEIKNKIKKTSERENSCIKFQRTSCTKKKTALYKNVHRQHASLSAS